MSFNSLIALVALCCSILPYANGEIENFDEKWRWTIENMTSPPETVSAQSLSCQGTRFDTVDDTCTFKDTSPAQSVHLLTARDIGIVAALGDSITAGFGAKSSGIFNSPTKESRGVSWSIGGDGDDYTKCTTIPNILKTFNPNLYGASTGSGDSNSGGANLNRAVSGAVSVDMKAQAEDLVQKIQQLDAGLQDEWKLVTLWIGGNDLCGKCGSNAVSAEDYVKNILEAINVLKGSLTKTLVNVAQALDVTKITDTTGLICGIVHWYACDCASEDGTAERAKEYMVALDELDVDSLSDDTFAVVIQPFFKGVELPRKDGKVDMCFFAPDCFHMSVLGHRAISAALWNNMISDADNKDHTWDPYNPVLKCPDPDYPYFYTSRTQAILNAQAQNDGDFNSQSLPSEEKTENDENDDAWSLGQIFGVTIGVAATSYMALVVIGGIIGGVVWVKRRRRAQPNNEAIPLVKK